jgi:hypothetical protein
MSHVVTNSIIFLQFCSTLCNLTCDLGHVTWPLLSFEVFQASLPQLQRL